MRCCGFYIHVYSYYIMKYICDLFRLQNHLKNLKFLVLTYWKGKNLVWETFSQSTVTFVFTKNVMCYVLLEIFTKLTKFGYYYLCCNKLLAFQKNIFEIIYLFISSLFIVIFDRFNHSEYRHQLLDIFNS